VERICGGCSFLGNNLISWSSENQDSLNLFSGKDKHTVNDKTWSKLSWIKHVLKEYNVQQDAPTLYCDYLSEGDISRSPIQENRTKQTVNHHHFTDHTEENYVILERVNTEEQIADIFTKALDAKQFEKLKGKLGICLHEEL
jgi:hypothetical protein